MNVEERLAHTRRVLAECDEVIERVLATLERVANRDEPEIADHMRTCLTAAIAQCVECLAMEEALVKKLDEARLDVS